MRFIEVMRTQSRVGPLDKVLNRALTRMISFTLAATAAFAKTGKGLITHTYASSPYFFIPF